jgi:E3 ubiquitin-protein ligase Topors
MYVIDQIVNMLPTHSIKSREFKAAVQPYFGAQTDHFIHEFYTFARSVYDMSGFDENAVYVYANNPNFATEVQEISSSDTDSDIEVIQTVKPNERRDSNKRKTTTTTATTSTTPSASSSGNGQGFKKILLKRAEGGGSNYVVSTSSSVAIEPVAGPSGLSTKLVQETIEVCESDPDEVEVLDYVKPEPELVTLSSGEEEEEVGQREDSRQRKPSNDITNFLNIFADGQSPTLSLSSTDLNFSTSVDANSSGESYHPTNEKRRSTCKSPKGKCKSDGSGLKGKQKRKYVRKTKKDKRSSSSESEKESRRCRRRRRSSSSVSSSSSSSSSSSDTSPSDYEPIAKYLTKKKDVRTSKKSKKLKKSRKKSKKESKRKVKSCVVVPRKNKVRYESEEDEDSSRPLESYWSQVKTSGKLTKVRLKRKRSNSSSSENSLRRVKYTSRIVYDTSDTSSGLSSNNSTNNVENSRTDNSGSDNQFDGNSTGTNQVASSSSEINIRINLNSDSSD